MRVWRAAKELGKKTVAIFADDDRFLPHVYLCDEAYPLEGRTVAETYLQGEQILAIAKRARADAIHPGYGFLSENAAFARACERAGILFIGPKAESIRTMGDKIAAKQAMRRGGVAVIPGSEGAVSLAEARELGRRLGYPLLLKAVSGGGGRGMRKVESEGELEEAYQSAQREAEGAFSDGSLYVERFFKRARHIEVQLLADQRGRVVHLGERECSLQRRHQKICEEAPARISRSKREALCEMAVAGARAIGYQNAGTMEFVCNEKGESYFMEMNTRVQVEHPVTELVTGIDILQEQIKIAEGESLKMSQKDVALRGHAIEFRINAEDPRRQFLPTPGRILSVVFPSGPGVRVDTFLYPHLTIPQQYDSLIAKLIVSAPTRSLCLKRARLALSSFHIRGIPTTIPFHLQLLDEPWFQKGAFHTELLTETPLDLPPAPSEEELAAVAFALYHGRAAGSDGQSVASLAWKRAARLVGVKGRND